MYVRVILKSVCDQGQEPLTTLHLRYPRFIHAEIMTHRVFSRNARSSRAVPVKTMIEEVLIDPVIPWHWTKNQPGMQGEVGHVESVLLQELESWMRGEDYHSTYTAEEAWLEARDLAVRAAKGFADAGYHKQISNRLLEPFMWIDVLVTADKWDNFFELRDHPDAEPHFQELAQMIRKAIDEADAQELTAGEWHLPYITEEDRAELPLEDLQKVSVARCARISYTPFDGNASYEREFERFKKLLGPPVHASAFEHVAQADWIDQPYAEWANPEQHRNFTGWNQYRAQFA